VSWDGDLCRQARPRIASFVRAAPGLVGAIDLSLLQLIRVVDVHQLPLGVEVDIFPGPRLYYPL
jgi:hypothetical protein